MSDKVKGLFSQHLLNERDTASVFKDREKRDLGPPDDISNGEGFEDSLDQGSDPSDFDVEDLGFDETEVTGDNFAQIYQKVDTITAFYTELLDPSNENNLTRLLAIGDRNDSITNGALQQLRKPILNTAKASQEIKAVLDQIASAEPSLRKKVEALKAN